MRSFWLTFSLCLLAVAAFSYWVDPLGHWHKSFFFKKLNPGEVFVLTSTTSERDLKFAQLGTIDRPDVITFGTSRVLLADQGMVNPKLKFFNMGVSGANVKEFVSFWQAIKDQNKVPKYLIIFIDPWHINANNLAGGQDKQELKYYLEFLRNNGGGFASRTRDQIQFFSHALKEDLHNARELIQWQTLTEAIRVLKDDRFQINRTSTILTEIGLSPKLEAIRADGSYIYPKGTMEALSLSKIRSVAKEFPDPSKDYMLIHFQVSAHDIELFKLLIQDMEKTGVKVLSLVAPFQQATLSRLDHLSGYTEVIPSYIHFVNLLKDKSEGAVCDRLQLSQTGCLETEMLDGFHMLKSCVKKVLTSCFIGTPGWATVAVQK